MRPAHGPVRRNLVGLADFVFDDAVQIGERGAEYGDHLLEPLPSMWHAPARGVGDAVGRYQFIHDSKRALVEGVLNHAADG